MKWLLALVLIISSIYAAYAGGMMLLHVGSADGNGAGGGNGKILLVDGASFILQTDGTSKICLAGGC